LKEQKNRRWIKEWYKGRPQCTHENHMTGLLLSEPNDHKILWGLDYPSFEGLLKIFTPTIAKEILT